MAAKLLLASLIWVLPAAGGRGDGIAVAADATEPSSEVEEDARVAALVMPWTGDLDGMVARGFLRIGVAYEPIFFSYDRASQQGLSVDLAQEFEKHLRATLGEGAGNLTVVLTPFPRDVMLDALIEGRVDLADREPHGDARAGRSGRLRRPDPHRRRRDRRHRAGRARDREPRRPGRHRGPRPPVEQLLRASGRRSTRRGPRRAGPRSRSSQPTRTSRTTISSSWSTWA